MASRHLSTEIYQKLFKRETPTPLRPKSVCFPELTSQISNLKLASRSAPADVIATLHLLNDDVSSAHTIVEPFYYQDIHTCDYQHGIVHIRDGDYSNARWWFGQLSHPLLVENFSHGASKKLSMSEARQCAKSFVGECQQVATGTSEGQRLERELYGQLQALADWSIQEFVENR